MSKGRLIALSSVASCLSVIFLFIGSIFNLLDLSCLFLTSIFMAIPLSKNTLKGAFLTYGATLLLSFIFSIGLSGYYISILYGVFFGLHPIINYIEKTKNLNKIVMLVIKTIWFILTIFMMYYLFTLFTDVPEFIEKYINYFIILGGAVVFFVYDKIVNYFQKYILYIICRLKI